MKKLSSLLLALAGSLACSGANGVPSHIVQPLPRELDPRLEQPLTPPSHIVRPLTEEETARRERELAPVPTAGLKEDGEKAIQTYSAQEKTVDGRIQEFRQQHQIAGNTPAPAAETTSSSAASGPEEGFLQANSPKDLYTVDCDGDLYFDMEEGVLVFMKNVRVRNPGLSLDCADHLKVYAEFVPKKPGDKKPSDIKKEKGKEGDQTQVALPNGGNFDYNSIKTVAASGNVKASYTNKQGETSNAQAEKITYNAKTGEIILTGVPVIVTPDVIVKNPNKDAFIRVYSNGNMYGSRGTKTWTKNFPTGKTRKPAANREFVLLFSFAKRRRHLQNLQNADRCGPGQPEGRPWRNRGPAGTKRRRKNHFLLHGSGSRTPG